MGSYVIEFITRFWHLDRFWWYWPLLGVIAAACLALGKWLQARYPSPPRATKPEPQDHWL